MGQGYREFLGRFNLIGGGYFWVQDSGYFLFVCRVFYKLLFFVLNFGVFSGCRGYYFSFCFQFQWVFFVKSSRLILMYVYILMFFFLSFVLLFLVIQNLRQKKLYQRSFGVVGLIYRIQLVSFRYVGQGVYLILVFCQGQVFRGILLGYGDEGYFVLFVVSGFLLCILKFFLRRDLGRSWSV